MHQNVQKSKYITLCVSKIFLESVLKKLTFIRFRTIYGRVVCAKQPWNRGIKMTITGTIKKNKREIPASMKEPSKVVPVSKFCHPADLTLLMYTPKKRKFVLLVSSYMHTTKSTDGQPNMIQHYNATKGGTGRFDQLFHAYTVTRRTNRWPIRIFFGMLDQAIVNARILRKCELVAQNSKAECKAIHWLEKVYIHLMKPFLAQRLVVLTLRKSIRLAIQSIVDENASPQRTYQPVTLENWQRCGLCPRKMDRKIKVACASCETPICKDHRLNFCYNCVSE